MFLFSLVKACIIDIWEDMLYYYMCDVAGFRGRIAKGCVREVSMAEVSCILIMWLRSQG